VVIHEKDPVFASARFVFFGGFHDF
jgi:hypothetical protein